MSGCCLRFHIIGSQRRCTANAGLAVPPHLQRDEEEGDDEEEDTSGRLSFLPVTCSTYSSITVYLGGPAVMLLT